ncbi:hypothetical protein Tco_0617844 [Tanacetum coccineum]
MDSLWCGQSKGGHEGEDAAGLGRENLRRENRGRGIPDYLDNYGVTSEEEAKGAILELKRRHLKNTIFCTYTPYPAMKIRRISAGSAQETRNGQFSIRRIHYNQYAVCTAVHQSKIHI